MQFYFDSSALAKRYIEEAGSDAVLHWCDKATELAISVIALPELVSAFCRLLREGKLSGEQYLEIKAQLLADITDALICDTTPGSIRFAVKALESQVLRGMDAIHIGAAMDCRADVFVTADARQAKAAQALGWVVQVL